MKPFLFVWLACTTRILFALEPMWAVLVSFAVFVAAATDFVRYKLRMRRLRVEYPKGPPAYEEPVECGDKVHVAGGYITCWREKGHEGSHRGDNQAISWDPFVPH